MRIDVRTEQKTCPPAIAARIAREGGFNRFGEPNYRLVWGWSRLTQVGGKWEEWELDKAGKVKSLQPITIWYGYRWLPKYEPWFCWHLERWFAPERYGSPWQWYEGTRVIEDGREFYELGPYPSRGEYEQCQPILDPTKPDAPFDLTPSLVEYIVRGIQYSRYLVNNDKPKALEAIRARQAKEQKDWSDYADGILGEADSAFGGEAFVSMAGSPRRVKDLRFKPTAAAMPGAGAGQFTPAPMTPIP